jgi:hypothetical protein
MTLQRGYDGSRWCQDGRLTWSGVFGGGAIVMPELGSTGADDRVLPLTRGIAAVIVPFLVVAFVVLYLRPGDTGRLFAWSIKPTMTAMVLGSAYLGGAYFFVQAARARSWPTVKAGFVPVAAFASLMGIATILHLNRFHHGHVAFWLWVLLYCTTPFLITLVWLRNRHYDAPANADELLLPMLAARVIAAVGMLALVTGLFLFLLPPVAMGVVAMVADAADRPGPGGDLLPRPGRNRCAV